MSLRTKPWWKYLAENQRDLLEQSSILLRREEIEGGSTFHDYAFVVFPAAKAYEGFLKKLFFDLGLIDERQFESNHYRIGKSLNPELPVKFRGNNWVFGRLIEISHDKNLPLVLWETWKESRNLLFHWFPKHENFISLPQAREKMEMIIKAIDKAFTESNIVSFKY